MAPVARFSRGFIVLIREDSTEVVLTSDEAQAVARVISPAAEAMRATDHHLRRHAVMGED